MPLYVFKKNEYTVFGDFLLTFEIRKEPTHPNPHPPFLRGWRGIISFYSLILFICTRLVSFTISLLQDHLVLSPNLFFKSFLFPVRAEIKPVLNSLFVSVPILLPKPKTHAGKAGRDKRVTGVLVRGLLSM